MGGRKKTESVAGYFQNGWQVCAGICRHRAEIVLKNYVELLKSLFPESLNRLNVIYFEDRFDCIHKKNETFNKSGTIQFGTDLLKRKNHLPAPEYETAVFKNLKHLVHRCSIYDCGSRRFDWHFHIADLLHYFATIALLAKNGFSAVDLISEKYFLHNMDNEEVYIEQRKKIWPDIKIDQIKEIYTLIKKTLTEHDLESNEILYKLALSHIMEILETANYDNSFDNEEDLKLFLSNLLNWNNEGMRKRIKQYKNAHKSIEEILDDLVSMFFN